MGKFYEGLFDDLKLYVRHCAWLNAVPDKAEGDKSKEPGVSRREGLKNEGIADPGMPDCDADHLIVYLFEIGPTVPSGMGDAPISHTEMLAWQQNVGISLFPWEARFLRRLSIEYLNESHKATKRDCPAPWIDAAALAAVANRNPMSLKDSLRELAKL